MMDDPKVRELLEAAKHAVVAIERRPDIASRITTEHLVKAISAIETPKPDPSMPEWDKLTAHQMRAISEAYTRAFNMDRGDEKTFYANVRDALAAQHIMKEKVG